MKFEDLTVADLKEKLSKKGLPVSGKKAELIDRLRSGKKTDRKVRECGPGKERWVVSNKCKKPCDLDKMRRPTTGRCVNVKDCEDGKLRNPFSFRCIDEDKLSASIRKYKRMQSGEVKTRATSSYAEALSKGWKKHKKDHPKSNKTYIEFVQSFSKQWKKKAPKKKAPKKKVQSKVLNLSQERAFPGF